MTRTVRGVNRKTVRLQPHVTPLFCQQFAQDLLQAAAREGSRHEREDEDEEHEKGQEPPPAVEGGVAVNGAGMVYAEGQKQYGEDYPPGVCKIWRG